MQDRLVFDKVTIDIPIYDVKSRSLKHRLVVGKVANLVARKPTSVGGNVLHGLGGDVTVRALDSVSFSASDGDRIAILGHNGAGKTTLLRTAAGIFEPTGGEVRARGRAMPLFNIMEGMSPDASGIEMMHVRGTLLGMSTAEIEAKSDDILEFCDLGEYINMPVRTYSAGMLVRLAFAITTAVSSEILIMDEIIGAGDAAFVEKAEKRLRQFVEKSSVMLVATHSPDIAKQWCNRALLFEHGRIVAQGGVEEVLETYRRSMGG